MKNKDIYYNALKENSGQLNEIDLGEKIGLDENETIEIIARLLFEHRIEYVENKSCNYSLKKKSKNEKHLY